ncbi:unnamed protein product [Arctogadus glacialis]
MEEVCVPGKVLPLWSSAPSGGFGGATDSFLSAARLARGGWRESSGPPRPQHSSPAGQEENYAPSPPTTGQRDTDRPVRWRPGLTDQQTDRPVRLGPGLTAQQTDRPVRLGPGLTAQQTDRHLRRRVGLASRQRERRVAGVTGVTGVSCISGITGDSVAVSAGDSRVSGIPDVAGVSDGVSCVSGITGVSTGASTGASAGVSGVSAGVSSGCHRSGRWRVRGSSLPVITEV